MPLFSDPLEPPGLRSAGRQLLRHGASLLALIGWSTFALGLAESGGRAWWLTIPGFLASLLGARSPIVSGVVELVLLAAGLTALPAHAFEWGVVGTALVLFSRALQITLLVRAKGG